MEKQYEQFIEARDSDIHGKGLFTNSDINAGDIVMIIAGERISESECIKREEEGNVYIFWNGDDNYIDVQNTDKIKYINHNCDCNCEVDDRDDVSLFLIASRDIKAGEELTIDYGYEEIYQECKCRLCA